MRILHTADWHVGRVWKNFQRLNETAKVLDHMARYIETQSIDLVLMAGDVFDALNPGAEGEKLVFDFLRRLGAQRVPSIVIAGNHDSPDRMDAWGMLAELAGTRVIGRPRSCGKGGVRQIEARSGETAMVAALPFAAPAVFVHAMELAGSETQVKSLYADRFKLAVQHLSRGFRPGCVNLLMAHTHLDGAVLSNSERQVHVGEDWAATPQSLPADAQYVALGHIHKPQAVKAAPAPTEYAGSLLQLDFGEAGQEKSFVVIEVKPGLPARMERIRYEGGKPLVDVKASLAELSSRQKELQAAGWLRVTVPLQEPDPELGRKVHDLLANAVQIRSELATTEAAETNDQRAGKGPVELYREYHQREHQRPPASGVAEAFAHLYEQCGDSRGV
jgi:exonuclease SbcD